MQNMSLLIFLINLKIYIQWKESHTFFIRTSGNAKQKKIIQTLEEENQRKIYVKNRWP